MDADNLSDLIFDSVNNFLSHYNDGATIPDANQIIITEVIENYFEVIVPEKYYYYVSFVYNNGYGYGGCSFDTNEPIKKPEDINILLDKLKIKYKYYNDIVIINWHKFG